MAYQLVDFSTKDLADQIEKQKNLDSYDAPGFDPTVLQELKKRVDAAVKMEGELAAKITAEHRAAKQQIDALEALIKKRGKSLTQPELAGIDRTVKAIADSSAAAEKEVTDAKAPLIPWRESWPDEWRKLLSDPKKVDPYVARRKQAIDGAPALTALRDRLKEYVKRSQDMQKAAKQLVTKVNQLAGNEQQEIAAFVKEINTYTAQCSNAAKSGAGAVLALWIKNVNMKKKATPDELKTAAEMLAKTEVYAKTMRGALKSFEIKMVTFKKAASRFNGQPRKDAVTAYVASEKKLKTAQSGVKALASNQAKATKMLATLNKSAAKGK